MKIAILGGTGKLGLAFALRFQETAQEVAIGSRNALNAEEAARKVGASVRGMANSDASNWCDVAIVSVPYAGHRSLLEPLKESLKGKMVIDATVPIDPRNIFQIQTESGKSAAEETAAIIGDADVFAAFQTISYRVLRRLDLSHDVLVAGGRARKTDVLNLVRSIRLHPVDAGPIEVAGHLERITALLLSINKANNIKESGIKITGV